MAGDNANLTEMEGHERCAHLPSPAFSKIFEAPLHLRFSRLQCDACEKAKFKPASLEYSTYHPHNSGW